MEFTTIFAMFFPACVGIIALWVILADKWNREDAAVRRTLHGRPYLVNGRTVILQEDGKPLMFMDGYEMPCRPISSAHGEGK
jgi:hypothetical protein